MKPDEVVARLYDLSLLARAKSLDLQSVAPQLDALGFMLANAANSHAQLFQDLWVLFETGRKRDGYFADIGAADGVHMSNTYLLEKQFGWSGIVADGNPFFREHLSKNRACWICTRCVAAHSGQTVAFNRTQNPMLATIERYSGSDFHAERRRDGKIVDVETISLSDLLEQAAAPDIVDYLSIDTEGSEFDILNAFDFSRRTFRFITVEHNFAPVRDDICKLLESHGFRRALGGLTKWDDWYRNASV